MNVVQIPNSDEMQKLMDDGVLKALKEIENSMKDGSLVTFSTSNHYQPGVLPYQQITFQISLLQKKDG